MPKTRQKRSYQKFRIICKICGDVFGVPFCEKDRAKYCSKKCRNDRRVWLKCQTCPKKFDVVLSRKNTARFCSVECRNNETAHLLRCQYCGYQFMRTDWEYRSYKSSYCSKECYKLGIKIVVPCNGCKKDVSIYRSQQKYYNKHYCSNECRIKFGPIGKLTANNIVDSNYYRFVRKVRHCSKYYEWRNKIRDRDHHCVVCSSEDNLTVHHKNISMYDFVRKYGFDIKAIYADSVFFDVKNGQLLCRSCHAKKHRE